MFRPRNIKMFEPNSPEYSLIDFMTEEVFENNSYELFYWRVNVTATESNMDDLDKVYGSTNSITKKLFSGPYRIYGALEVNPIIHELTKMGLEQIEEVDLVVNQTSIFKYLEGALPSAGDVFRVTYIEQQQKRKYSFYVVSNVEPVDLFDTAYINLVLKSEQTALQDVPDEIKNYVEGD